MTKPQIEMDITDICFERIKLDDVFAEYHKALYGPFVIIMMKTHDYRNGYINATKLCTDGGKSFGEWSKLYESKELIDCLEQNFGICDLSYSDVRGPPACVEISRGMSEEDRLISGTYVHPKLILPITTWLSPEYYIKVSDIVNKHFVRQFNTELSNDKNKLDKLKLIVEEYQLLVEYKNNLVKNSNNQINSTVQLDNMDKQIIDSVNKLNFAIEKLNKATFKITETINKLTRQYEKKSRLQTYHQ